MRPKVELVMSVVGPPKLGVLVRLVASARTSSLTRSFRAIRLRSDESISNQCGPMKKLRPVLPNWPAAGAENLARSAASKYQSRPEAVSVNADPSPRLQPVQFAVD